MTTKEGIEIFMGIIMAIVILGILIRSIFYKKGIGARTIQFVSISFLIPAIIILAMEKVLSGETVGTLLGGIAGYVLSGISNYDNPLKNKDD